MHEAVTPAPRGPVLELSGEWMSPRELAVEIWRARELIGMLARKDFFVRYRRQSFGVLWAVGLPLVQAAVLSVVFSYFRVIKIGAGVPLPVYVFTGMAAWSYFSTIVTAASTSIVDGAGLSSKVYFPRAVLTLVHVRIGLYTLPINIAIVLVMALAWGVGLSPKAFLLIPGVMLLVWLTASLSLTLAALHVYFRDVRYIVQAVFTALIYLTPLFLPLAIYGKVGNGYLQDVVLANPITGVVEVFRLAIGGADSQWPTALAWTLGWSVVFTISAVYIHCRRNRLFVDLL